MVWFGGLCFCVLFGFGVECVLVVLWVVWLVWELVCWFVFNLCSGQFSFLVLYLGFICLVCFCLFVWGILWWLLGWVCVYSWWMSF